MGRKSALSDDEWAKAIRRVLVDGETVNSVAKDIGIDEASLRRKIKPNKSESGKNNKSLKELAIGKAAAENALKNISDEISELPISSQRIVGDLTKKLVSISNHLAGAAEYGAMTAHRLSSLANTEVQKIDDVDPLSSLEAVKGVAVLTKLANDSAEIGLNLLRANKETVDNLNKADDRPEPKQIVFTVIDASA